MFNQNQLLNNIFIGLSRQYYSEKLGCQYRFGLMGPCEAPRL